MASSPTIRRFLTGVCALAAVPLMASGAHAAPLKSGDAFGDWLADCPKAPDGKTLPCRMVQVQEVKAQNGQTVKLVKSAIIPLSNNEKILIGHIPLGYFVPGGVEMSIDEKKATQMVLQRCVPQGCEVATKLTPELAAAMKKGKAAKMHFRLGNKHAYLPVSLKGTTKALAAMK